MTTSGTRPLEALALDRLVIGLGNPGAEYERTPHNLGFHVIDRLARAQGVSEFEELCDARFASFELAAESEPSAPVSRASQPADRENLENVAGEKKEEPAPSRGRSGVLRVGLAQPLTFMNRSGLAVRCLVEEFSLDPSDLLVVYDEVALPLGELRLRPSGSPGGHRGMESVVYNLRTADIARLRCGVGPCPEDVSLTEYVLAPFDADAEPAAADLAQRASDCARFWCTNGVAATMNRFNGRPPAENGEESSR